MNHRHLLSLMLIILITIPLTGWGQALFDPKNIVYEPSRLFPIVAETDIVGAPDDAIEKNVIEKIYDRCMSRTPNRFTPDAHQYYCTCSAAATQGTMTNADLRNLQKDKNRVLGNKSFEKYVHNVVKPCMDMPVEDMEYMYCIMYRDNDWRIKFPIPFCKCTSRGIRKYFEESGETDMMIAWANNKTSGYKDPIDALWGSELFQAARTKQRKSCVGRYMDTQYFKN